MRGFVNEKESSEWSEDALKDAGFDKPVIIAILNAKGIYHDKEKETVYFINENNELLSAEYSGGGFQDEGTVVDFLNCAL